MPTLSPTYDIKSLIERYASIQYANKGRPSTSNGVQEYHSNCPWCPGSRDSFIMRPELGDYSHAIRSSGCGRHGDCIDFLKDFMHMSHSEACEILQIEANADFVPSIPFQSAHVGNEQPPNAKWIETGMLLVERAVHALWHTSEGRVMLDYLHGRGLGDDIIKKKKLGYIPLQSNGRFYEAELEQWGLDPAKETKDKVRIPNGILIPWMDGSTLWRLGLKRIDKNEYGQVLGSGEGLFNVGEVQYDTPAMIVEGEICAMSVEQECGNLVACVATGSTTRGRLNRWIAELGLASHVLQSFDEDESGDTGAEYWLKNLKKCMRWSPLVAKDPNDILRGKYFDWAKREGGYSLRDWVQSGIESAKVEFELALPFVFPPSEGDANVPSIPPCKVESLLQSKNHLPPWSQKDLQDWEEALSKMKVYGPEVDLNILTIQEYERSHLVPGICLNKDCPCQEVWGKWVLERALDKKRKK